MSLLPSVDIKKHFSIVCVDVGKNFCGVFFGTFFFNLSIRGKQDCEGSNLLRSGTFTWEANVIYVVSACSFLFEPITLLSGPTKCFSTHRDVRDSQDLQFHVK